MNYTLFLDKATEFDCNIELTGASVTDAKVRMVVEIDGTKIQFDGSVDADGKGLVVIPALRKFMDDNATGTMTLEVIADGEYFTPWESRFTAEATKSVKAMVVERSSKSAAPTVRVDVPEVPILSPADAIATELRNKGITTENHVLENLHVLRDLIKLHAPNTDISDDHARTQLIDSVVGNLKTTSEAK